MQTRLPCNPLLQYVLGLRHQMVLDAVTLLTWTGANALNMMAYT